MKATIYMLLWLILINLTFAQNSKDYFEFPFGFTPKQIRYAFGDDVKLRTSPDLTARVISLLPISARLEILEKDRASMEYDGLDSNWYKVKHQNQVGYVLGGLISLEKLETKDGRNFVFQVKRNSDDAFFLKCRILGNEKTYKEFKFPLVQSTFSLLLEDGKGLMDVDNIICIDYLAEACGAEGGETYLVRMGDGLSYLAETSSVADADLFSLEEKLIFPNDYKGIKNTIIFKSEIYTLEDEQTNWKKRVLESKEYQWNGKKLTPSFKTIN